MTDWEAYRNATSDRPPRPTLIDAADGWEAEHAGATAKRAVDLGCGEGRDAVELLRRGWHVIAVDADAGGLARLQARPDLPPTGRLEPVCARMEDATWPAVDLVNASFSLPFCEPRQFFDLWKRIIASLAPGGRFAGHLLGPHDSWAEDGLLTFERAEIEMLLRPFAIERLDEVNEPGRTAVGAAKHWHVFHIVGRRLSDAPKPPAATSVPP